MPIVQSTDYSRCANKLFSQSRANCQTTKPRASMHCFQERHLGGARAFPIWICGKVRNCTMFQY